MTWAERVRAKWDDANRNMPLKHRLEKERHRKLVGWCRATTWDVFWTQTYRGRHSEFAAQTRWLSFLAAHNSQFQCSKVLFCIEPHPNSPSHHVHALLSMNSVRNSTDGRSAFQRWNEDWRLWKEKAWRTLGKALILPVTDNDAVAYVLKYVTKPARCISWMEHTPQPASPENLWGVWTPPPRDDRLWVNDCHSRAIAEDSTWQKR